MTFAALFACGILGLSVTGSFREFLSGLGAPWYVWLPAPIVAVAILAKKETSWLPEADARRKWARRIFFGSLVLAVALAWLLPAKPEPPAQPIPDRRSHFHK